MKNSNPNGGNVVINNLHHMLLFFSKNTDDECMDIGICIENNIELIIELIMSGYNKKYNLVFILPAAFFWFEQS